MPIRKTDFNQSFVSNTDFETQAGMTAPDESPLGLTEYADSVETVHSNTFDFTNPADARGIIVVGGRPNPGSDRGIIVVGGKDADSVQIQDVNFEGGHSSLSGEVGTQSFSLKNLPGDLADGAGDVVDWFGDATARVGYDITHPAAGVYDAGSGAQNAIVDVYNAISKGISTVSKGIDDGATAFGNGVDDAGSAAGKFITDAVGSETIDWLHDRVEDTGDVLLTAADDTKTVIYDTADAIGDAFKDTPLPDVTDAIADAAEDALNFIKNLATDPFGTLNQAASDGEHAIEKTGQDVVQFGGQMVAAATDAAGNVIDWMGDAAKDAANWIGGAAEDTADWVGGVVDDLF